MIIIRDSVVKVVGRCSNFLTLTTSETLSHQGTHGFSGRSDAFFNFLRGEIEKHIYVMYIKRISKSDHFDHQYGSMPVISRPTVGG